MKLKQAQVVALLLELGVKTASQQSCEKLSAKLQKLPKLKKAGEIEDAKSADGKSLLKKILRAVEAEEDIEIVPTAKVETKAPIKSDKAPTKAGKKAAKEEEDEEEEESEDEESEDEDAEEEEEEEAEEEEESEDEESEEEESDEEESEEEDEEEDEEEEEEKPAKKLAKKGDKKTGKKGAEAFKGPGIIKRIREIMEKTTEKKPVTKQDIVDTLMKEFPGRDHKSLMKTVTGQVSYFLRDTNKKQESPLDIRRNEKGYYVSA